MVDIPVVVGIHVLGLGRTERQFLVIIVVLEITRVGKMKVPSVI